MIEADTAVLRGELKKVIEHHISLGVEAIFSGVFMGNNPKHVSFHHLLNRCMMLAQAPITFLIFIQEGENFREIYKTNKHKNEEHQNTIKRMSKKCLESPDDYLIPLWIDEKLYKNQYENGTYHRYHLAVLTADTFEFTPLKRVRSLYKVRIIWDAIAYKIEEIFKANKYTTYGETFYSYLNKSITNLIPNQEQIQEESTNKHIGIDKKDLSKDFFKHLQENTTAYSVVGTGVIDRVFAKLQKAIQAISMQDGDTLTNFFFYVRDYDDTYLSGKKRYGEYDYNIRLLIGQTQKHDLIKHFETWKKIETQNDLKKILNEQIKGFDKQTRNFIDSLFEAFIKRVNTENGCEELVVILSKEFGNQTRSIADPVFDGVSFYRAPFDRDGGIGRSFPRGVKPQGNFNDIQEASVKDDLLRVMTFFFLLESMATKSNFVKDTQLRVMLNPIEIGGRCWAVAGYVSRSFDLKESLLSSMDVIEEYNRFWLQNYHICNDVNERMKKNLRTYMNRLYEDTIAKEYVKWIGAMAVKININKKSRMKEFNLVNEVNYFNSRLKALTCFFPYDMVEVSVERTDEDMPEPRSDGVGNFSPRAFLVKNFAIKPRVIPSSFFPNAPGEVSSRKFVDAMDLAIAMTDGILRTVFDMNRKDLH